MVVTLAKVYDLASVLLQPCRVLVPDTLIMRLQFLLNFEQSVMKPTLDRVCSALTDLSQRQFDKLSGQVFAALKSNADCLLCARHVLRFVVYLATDDSLADEFSSVVGQRLLVPVGVADAWHIDVGQVAKRIIVLLRFLADGDQADLISALHGPGRELWC